jgi:hypothetical protein
VNNMPTLRTGRYASAASPWRLAGGAETRCGVCILPAVLHVCSCTPLGTCTPSGQLRNNILSSMSGWSTCTESAAAEDSLPSAAADGRGRAAPPAAKRVPPAAAGPAQPADTAAVPQAASEADRTAAAAKEAVLSEPAGALAPQPGLPADVAELEQEQPSATAAGAVARDTDAALANGRPDSSSEGFQSATSKEASTTSAAAAATGAATATAAAAFAAKESAEGTPTANGDLHEAAPLPQPLADVPIADSPPVSCLLWALRKQHVSMLNGLVLLCCCCSMLLNSAWS